MRKYVVPKYTIAPLDEIHWDVVKINPRAFNGHQYGIIGTDKATTCRWSKTFATKAEAFLFIRHFPAFCKTQYGKIPKRYRIDGGREYSPEELKEFL